MVGGRAAGGEGGGGAPGVRTAWVFCELLVPQLSLGSPEMLEEWLHWTALAWPCLISPQLLCGWSGAEIFPGEATGSL